MTVARDAVNGPWEDFTRALRLFLRPAGQHDEVVAPGSKRLPLEPAVDGLDLEVEPAETGVSSE